MAGHSKYTPEVIQTLVEAIKLGETFAGAAAAAGISADSFKDWRQNKPELRDIIEKAQSDMRTSNLQVIKNAANKGNWTAAAWLLERRYSVDFARQQVEHSGPSGGPIIIANAAEVTARAIRENPEATRLLSAALRAAAFERPETSAPAAGGKRGRPPGTASKGQPSGPTLDSDQGPDDAVAALPPAHDD